MLLLACLKAKGAQPTNLVVVSAVLSLKIVITTIYNVCATRRCKSFDTYI